MRNFKLILFAVFVTVLMFSCAVEPELDSTKKSARLELYAQFSPLTRLAELPADQIGADNKGLKNVGLYMYYADDYNAGVLSKPYIRNMECTVTGGKLVPVDPLYKDIYVYDRMVIVAFYPYNNSVINFNVKSDEEAYPITRSEYDQQVYIPYRAQASLDPTTAYRVNLQFIPKHTSKIEITIVGSPTSLPLLTNPQVLPLVDPVNAPAGSDSREKMVDFQNDFNNTGGGMSVSQFIAYVWTEEQGSVAHDPNSHADNIINIGDPVFQSDELTLVASQTVNFSEDRIYRYGYNMTTGEVFIPTSSKLVYDVASLTASPNGYQVCDLDLSAIPNWTPINVTGNNYDGGGHKITGLAITSLPASGNVGLFGRVQGNATISNVNLVSPRITINAANAAANVGAICGLNNQTLTLTAQDIAAMRAALVASLPPGVASVVIDALLQDQILQLKGGTSTISGCKVSDAIITLTGKSLKAGLICGKNGDLSAPAIITDSYAMGVINANVNVGTVSDTCFVAGVTGLNNSSIIRSYTTAAVVAEKYTSATPAVKYNGGAGFCFQGPRFASNNGAVTSCYAAQANTQPVVPLLSVSWPAWSIYTGKWPVYGTVAPWRSMGNSATPTYPTLVWEQ